MKNGRVRRFWWKNGQLLDGPIFDTIADLEAAETAFRKFVEAL
jgi:hypothetical protein